MVSGDYFNGSIAKDLTMTWEGFPMVENAPISKSNSWSAADMDYRLLSVVVRATTTASTITFIGLSNNGP
jgi:hypothetical protein